MHAGKMNAATLLLCEKDCSLALYDNSKRHIIERKTRLRKEECTAYCRAQKRFTPLPAKAISMVLDDVRRICRR